MASSIRERHKNALPKYNKYSLERVIGIVGALAGIAGVVLLIWDDEVLPVAKYLSAVVFLIVLTAALVAKIVITESDHTNRYALAMPHLHFSNHRIRDHLADALTHSSRSTLNDTLQDIVNSVAQSFSLVCGRPCRASIAEITREIEIKTIVRDTLSKAGEPTNPPPAKNPIDANTDFYDIWYAKDGSWKHFLCNDLVARWANHRYENTSFERYGKPEMRNYFGFRHVAWPLPYRSTMVFPIRYIADASRWPPREGTSVSATATSSDPHVWGYLCVDCPNKNVFKLPYCADLGAAFADSLYTLFTQEKFMQEHPAGAIV